MELTSLETTFYTLGIILMSLIVILMVVSVIMIFYIKHKITLIQRTIEEKIRDVTQRPQEIAYDLGAGLVSKFINRKKKK
jgi:predicted lipid-binding transport protein (Tim44 family)